MTSELVDGSAWMKPPVCGCAAVDTGAVACALALPPVPVCEAEVTAVVCVSGDGSQLYNGGTRSSYGDTGSWSAQRR